MLLAACCLLQVYNGPTDPDRVSRYQLLTSKEGAGQLSFQLIQLFQQVCVE